MRKVLAGAIELVRFPLMTIEEFAAGPAQSDVLEKEEVVDIFLHFAAPNPKVRKLESQTLHQSFQPTIPYPDKARCCHTGKEEVVSRFSEYASRWGYSGTCDRIRFTVSRKIYVVGLGLYGSIHSGTSTEYRVMMQIIHSETNNICGQNETSFRYFSDLL
jgi:BTB/POZ domain-containing protein 1/2